MIQSMGLSIVMKIGKRIIESLYLHARTAPVAVATAQTRGTSAVHITTALKTLQRCSMMLNYASDDDASVEERNKPHVYVNDNV